MENFTCEETRYPEFFISSKNLSLVYQHLNEISKQKHLTSATDFYEYQDNPEFIYMIFIIANCLTNEQYDEALIIGAYRDYLNDYGVKYFEIILNLSRINQKFCQFNLWSWDFNFEIEKYNHLEKILWDYHHSHNQP